MSRDPEYDVTLDGVGYILTRDGLGVSRVQANPYAMKSSSGERTYADLDEWAVFQVSSCHRGMGQERYGDPEHFWYAQNADTRFKDKIICPPVWTDVDSTNMTGASDERMYFTHFGDKLFCASDDEVFELVAGSWTSRDEVVGEDITDMVAFNDYLYVARGANSIRKSTDGTNWTDVADIVHGTKLYVHGGFLYVSWGNLVSYSSDPEDASPTWSTDIANGRKDIEIRSMCTYQNSLIVFKNSGAWRIPGNPGDLDTAYRVPELDWRSYIHSNNGKYSCVWSDGFLYVSNGDSGLLRWTGRTVTPIGPDTLLANNVTGDLVGLIPTPNFLYTSLANSGDDALSFLLVWNGSGWHCLQYMVHTNPKALYFFDGYLYWGAYTASTTDHNVVWKLYMPAKTQDPTQDPNYLYTDGYFYFSHFTANLHHTYKEFRSVTIWVDNMGGTATSGDQTVTFAYSVDGGSPILPTGGTITAYDEGQESFTINFTAPSFTEKQVASIDADRDTVTLTSSDVVSDLSTGDWLYFAGVNEYRYVARTGGTAGAYTITLSCPLDSAPATNTYIRPGVPVGRYFFPQLGLGTGDPARTPVVRAMALKYLVNIGDYDIWQLNIQLADPLTLRNGNTKRQPIADQLSRLDEIRKKGRVTFVDEVGDSHTVKITNFSLQPVRQRTDSKMEAEAAYQAKLTLLEV